MPRRTQGAGAIPSNTVNQTSDERHGKTASRNSKAKSSAKAKPGAVAQIVVLPHRGIACDKRHAGTSACHHDSKLCPGLANEQYRGRAKERNGRPRHVEAMLPRHGDDGVRNDGNRDNFETVQHRLPNQTVNVRRGRGKRD